MATSSSSNRALSQRIASYELEKAQAAKSDATFELKRAYKAAKAPVAPAEPPKENARAKWLKKQMGNAEATGAAAAEAFNMDVKQPRKGGKSKTER